MASNMFDTFWKHISWIHQNLPYSEGMYCSDHCRVLVDGLIEIFNWYIVQMISLSHMVWVDKSIFWWHENVVDYITLGLLIYVAINYNTNNAADIQDTDFGVSVTMIRSNIVKVVPYSDHNNVCNYLISGKKIILHLMNPWCNINQLFCWLLFFFCIWSNTYIYKLSQVC